MIETNVRSRMPPPLPSLLGFLLGLVCGWLWPWQVARYEYVLPAGLLFIGLVMVLFVTTSRAIKHHGTTSNPYKETTALVDTGPFRFSRNPMYVAVAFFQIALGLLFNNMWVLLFIIPAFIVIHYVVVLREEVYLEAKFGDEYLGYKGRVRRWI